MNNKSEALFQEHWRRFFLSPQADSAAVRRISGALYWNDQLLWSLGVIPWGAWRLPFQASILRFLHEALPHDAARLYTSIHTALATAHGDFLSSPSEMDKQKLVQRVEQFCEGETSAHLVRQIQSITPNQPFFRNAALESMVRRISVKYREKLRQRENAYYACLFHFRVLQAFLERLEPLLFGESQAIRNSVALLSWQALFDADPEPIQLFPEKRITADLRHISGEIYNFWSWQYTCRNEEYQKLRAVLEPLLQGSGPISIVPCVPVSNLKEYQTITGRLETRDGLGQELFAACNQAIDAMVEKFGYFPAWPIVDYTSDFIFDFVARQKVGGTHLTYGYLNQLPLLSPSVFDSPAPCCPSLTLADWIRPRVLELTYTAEDMRPFAKDMGYDGDPFVWDEERRAAIRAELDAAFFHLYLPTNPAGTWKKCEKETEAEYASLTAVFPTPRDAVAYIMETFPITKKKDEDDHGFYRTKEMILQQYDMMMGSISK